MWMTPSHSARYTEIIRGWPGRPLFSRWVDKISYRGVAIFGICSLFPSLGGKLSSWASDSPGIGSLFVSNVGCIPLGSKLAAPGMGSLGGLISGMLACSDRYLVSRNVDGVAVGFFGGPKKRTMSLKDKNVSPPPSPNSSLGGGNVGGF